MLVYQICPNTTNYPIFNMQDFNCAPPILECCGLVVSQCVSCSNFCHVIDQLTLNING